jgi:hypothetical protein
VAVLRGGHLHGRRRRPLVVVLGHSAVSPHLCSSHNIRSSSENTGS